MLSDWEIIDKEITDIFKVRVDSFIYLDTQIVFRGRALKVKSEELVREAGVRRGEEALQMYIPAMEEDVAWVFKGEWM